MNSKAVLAIIVAVIVVIAGAGAAILMMNSNNSNNSETYVHTQDLNEEKLAIFGNANNDTSIDTNDITAIKNLIKDGDISRADNQEKYEKNYMADANQDKVIDSKDYEYVQTMIDGTAKSVYYENVEGNAVSYKLAEKTYIITGHRTYARSAVLLSNASTDVTIVGGVDSSINEDEFKDVVPSGWVDVGKQGTPNTETISQIATNHSDGNTIFITGASNYYCDGYEAKFGDNVQFVRMIAWEGSSMTGLLTLGYLLDGVGNDGSTGSFGQAKAYETFYHKYADPITNYVNTLSESQKRTCVVSYVANDLNNVSIPYLVTKENTFRNESSSDYQMSVLAGGNNAIDWFKTAGGSAYGGNGIWTCEGLAAGLQGHTLDVFIVGVNMFMPSSDCSDVPAAYDAAGKKVAEALTGYLPSNTEIYLKNYNFTGIPCIMDLVFEAKILCKDSAAIQAYDLEAIWGEYLDLYTNHGTVSGANLAYSNIGIGSGPYYTTTTA